MRKKDRQDYITRYEERLTKYGYSPETLGWGKHGRQKIRFNILTEYALNLPESSVLDVGCGFADLYDFLIDRKWHGQYTGIDIVPGLLNLARERQPHLNLKNIDIISDKDSLRTYDFIIASGVFNAKLKVGDNSSHIISALTAMFDVAREAVCVDFLSSYVDFKKPGSWHTDPGWLFKEAKRLSRRVILRHDYMPFEFTIFIFRDDSISHRNVFKVIEGL